MENKVIVGKIVSTIGLKGEVRVVTTSENAERLQNANVVFISGISDEFVCERVRTAGKSYAIKFANLNKIEDVEGFRGRNLLLIANTDYKLAEDEYFVDDLIDCKIQIGNDLAVITDVENFGAGDILVFELNGTEMRIPFLTNFFDKIDVQNKLLVASEHFLEGAV